MNRHSCSVGGKFDSVLPAWRVVALGYRGRRWDSIDGMDAPYSAEGLRGNTERDDDVALV